MIRLLLFIMLAAPLAAADFTPDPLTVRVEGTGYRYPQAGWIVLHIEGEPYERGYQHGKLLAAEIGDNVASLAAQQSKADPVNAWAITRTMVSAVFLRKMDKEHLEEMQGIADGAAACGAAFNSRPVDLLDIACLNLQMEYETLDNAVEAMPTGLESMKFPKRQPKVASAPAADHCSAFAATGPATADGKLVIGHITMSGLANALVSNVWIDVKPSNGHRIVMQGFPGAIWSAQDYYINSAGIVLTETTIRQTRFNPEGTPLTSRCRRAMQYGSTIDDVVKILIEKNNGLYTNEWLLGDANTNEIAMLELGTTTHTLRRSSRNEWYLTEGFYWGCNNTKDLAVRLDTQASLVDRPQDLSWKPSDRDRAWLKLFSAHRGKIDAEFGKLAFRTSPLAGKPSLDAKVTTAALAKELKSHALFGPPTGRLWEVTQREKEKYHDVRSLVPNDWALLTANKPTFGKPRKITDFTDKLPERLNDPHTIPAWHGTLLPKSDEAVWLTAGFAAYERVVALEASLKKRSGGALTPIDNERIELALFQHNASYLAAIAAKPTWRSPSSNKSPMPIERELDRDRWHAEQVGLGVHRLARLRERLGDDIFLKEIDTFGRGYAGKTVTSVDFVNALNLKLGDLDYGLPSNSERRPVSITGWMNDPESTVIVYGTRGDAAGNKVAARELQRTFRVKWTLHDIPVIEDTEMNDTALAAKHVLLIGRPIVNAMTRKLESAFPVTFGEASAVVNGKAYAHERSAVIVGGVNPFDPHYSTVVIAGFSADATFHAASLLPNAASCEVLLIPRGTSPVPLVVQRTRP